MRKPRGFLSTIFNWPLLLPLSLAAQQGVGPDEVSIRSGPYVPKTAAAFSTETRLVDVPVTVRDKKGNPVAGLGRGDFEVYDSGKKQTISSFSVLENRPLSKAAAPAAGEAKPATVQARPAGQSAAPSPRFTVLLFDDVNQDNASLGDELVHAVNAGVEFVKEGLAPGQRAAVFGMAAGPVSPFTSDPAVLIAAMRKLRKR